MIDTQESITAKLCAFARAYHSYFERRKIFDDYLAYDLMGKEQYDEIGQLIERNYDLTALEESAGFNGKVVYPAINRMISPIPLSRIAFAEEALDRFAAKSGTCQYVICGAGMDTFSFRNTNPAIEVFELDHPDTRRYKLDRVKALEWHIPQNVRFVPIDFSKDDLTQVLPLAGFAQDKPSFFAVLGVTYYLSHEVFEDTIQKISRLSAPGTQLVFDFPDETFLSRQAVPRVRELTRITEKLGEPMEHGFSPAEIRAILTRHGFAVKVYQSPREIQSAYFANRTDGQTAYENIHFILAEKEGS